MARTTWILFTASLLALALAACGGDSHGTGPVDEGTATDYCRQDCEHDFECDATVDVDACTESCVDEVVGWVREDVFVDVTDCFTALECNANDDACFVDNCEPTASHDTYETECRAAFASCDLAAEEIDGICETDPSQATGGDAGFFCAVTPSIMDEFTACFDEEGCQPILDCIVAVAEANGVDV